MNSFFWFVAPVWYVFLLFFMSPLFLYYYFVMMFVAQAVFRKLSVYQEYINYFARLSLFLLVSLLSRSPLSF